MRSYISLFPPGRVKHMGFSADVSVVFRRGETPRFLELVPKHVQANIRDYSPQEGP